MIISFSDLEGGASNNKCSETYHGPSACSEIECQNIRDYVLTLDPVPVLATCFHSYSQLYLWPYGYAYDAYPENYEEIRDLAQEAVKALEAVHGTVFDPINSADLCKYFIFLSIIQFFINTRYFLLLYIG